MSNKGMMYNSRYANIHRVCYVLNKHGAGTATHIAKHCELTRQAVNRILKDAENRGYVTFEEKPHRPNMTKRVWRVTDWWLANSDNHIQYFRHRDELKQLRLI